MDRRTEFASSTRNGAMQQEKGKRVSWGQVYRM